MIIPPTMQDCTVGVRQCLNPTCTDRGYRMYLGYLQGISLGGNRGTSREQHLLELEVMYTVESIPLP